MPTPTTRIVIQFDLTAPAVIRAWQSFLVGEGHDVVVDGIFGPATTAATVAVQDELGLPPTGELDPQTFASISKAPARNQQVDEPELGPAATSTPRPTPIPEPTATPRPRPTATAVPPPAPPIRDCHPSYDPCLTPNIGDYDCSGGSGNGPNYTGTVRVTGWDEFDLDRDSDGWGCE